jgi:hypothetical protein
MAGFNRHSQTLAPNSFQVSPKILTRMVAKTSGQFPNISTPGGSNASPAVKRTGARTLRPERYIRFCRPSAEDTGSQKNRRTVSGLPRFRHTLKTCAVAKKEPGPKHLHAWSRAYTWRRPTLTRPIVSLPLALRRFTSGFGMGPGGSTALWSPEGNFSGRASCFWNWVSGDLSYVEADGG